MALRHPGLNATTAPGACRSIVRVMPPRRARRHRRRNREEVHANPDRGDHRDRPDRRCAHLDAPTTVAAVAGGLRPRIRAHGRGARRRPPRGRGRAARAPRSGATSSRSATLEPGRARPRTPSAGAPPSGASSTSRRPRVGRGRCVGHPRSCATAGIPWPTTSISGETTYPSTTPRSSRTTAPRTASRSARPAAMPGPRTCARRWSTTARCSRSCSAPTSSRPLDEQRDGTRPQNQTVREMS